MTKLQGPMLLLIALLVSASCAHETRAQDAPTFNAARVPATGASEKEFVPGGWKVNERAEGDLNGDGRPDRVLQLVPADYDSSGVVAAPEAQALLILLSEGGGLRRAGLATRVLVSVVPQYSLGLSVKNGVLVVNQNFGMTDVSDLTHRFRYEPATGRFLLIGKDTFSYHRPQGPRWPAVKVSENYLTGVRVTSTERWRGENPLRPAEKREQFARSRLFLEDVDEDPDN